VYGESNCASLTSGHKFDLTEHPIKKANQAYHLLAVRHAASIPNYVNGDGEFDYTCSFEAIPATVPYRPPLATHRPTVRGTQTAIVTGPSGEEIYTDKLGRVKLHFHWDRRGKFDENSSCWVRVSFAWAGKGYGNFSVPRIGQEVIVDFIEGDPDQPIVVGRVYNGDQVPPCDPGGKRGVISGLRSKTHKGSGFNEMTMDDTAGKEMIAIHAQYDMSTTVGHDDTQSVKNDRTISVTGKHTETVKADTSVTVSDGNYTFTVAKGTGTFKIEKKVTETYNDAQETTVKNNIAIKSTAGKISIDAANEIKLHTGSSTITMKSDGSISIHGKKIEIIGDDEVKVSAPKVAVSGGQEAKFGVGNQQITCDVAKVNTSGAAINSSAVGMHESAGALG
jgi:type VI secretion system secreted protein VgrG